MKIRQNRKDLTKENQMKSNCFLAGGLDQDARQGFTDCMEVYDIETGRLCFCASCSLVFLRKWQLTNEKCSCSLCRQVEDWKSHAEQARRFCNRVHELQSCGSGWIG